MIWSSSFFLIQAGAEIPHGRADCLAIGPAWAVGLTG